MFVLNELDRLLQDIGSAGKSKQNNVKISIPDLEPIDVGRLNLPAKLNLPYGPPLTFDQIAKNRYQNHPLEKISSLAIDGQRYPTTNSIFLNLMNQFVFSKLAKLPERHYPWAKLLLCDRFSYDLLLKHERILSLAANDLRNFLYRAPFVITAIFELDNIVTLFELSGEPLILIRRDPRTGKSIATYNYAPVKKVFPYLRMSDLVVLIEDRDLLSAKLSRIIHFLAHFARSFQLIELGGLNKIIGLPHPIYNNVLVIRPKLPDWTDYYAHLPLSYLSFMATQLASIADKLKLRLETVTYRAADPQQQTRVFAHFLSTAVDKKEHDLLDSRVARVLVMDRFHDLRGTLLHADRFEAFLVQEKSQIKLLTATSGNHCERPTLGSVDEQLNTKLHLVRLTEVLGVILRHAMHLKPTAQTVKASKQNEQALPNRRRPAKFTLPTTTNKYSLSAAMSTSQSIRRNLETVKILYKSLNEGYLILLKLESSLEGIISELRQSEKPLDETRQVALAERLYRLVSACRQLIKASTKTIDMTDITRLSCLVADAINLFNVHSRSDKVVDLVDKAKQSLLSEKDLGLENGSRFESYSGASNLFKRYQAFDSLSVSTCGQRSALSIDEVIEQMLDNRLSEKSYPTSNLVKEPKFNKDARTTIVLTFLGALTASELARIKLIEIQLKKQSQLCDILVLSSALVAPDDFLAAL